MSNMTISICMANLFLTVQMANLRRTAACNWPINALAVTLCCFRCNLTHICIITWCWNMWSPWSWILRYRSRLLKSLDACCTGWLVTDSLKCSYELGKLSLKYWNYYCPFCITEMCHSSNDIFMKILRLSKGSSGSFYKQYQLIPVTFRKLYI